MYLLHPHKKNENYHSAKVEVVEKFISSKSFSYCCQIINILNIEREIEQNFFHGKLGALTTLNLLMIIFFE